MERCRDFAQKAIIATLQVINEAKVDCSGFLKTGLTCGRSFHWKDA